MNDPRAILKNPYIRMSYNQTAAFSTDHLQRLTVQNGSGDWTARIAATTTVMSTFENAVDGNLIKAGLRKSRKQAKDDTRDTVIKGAEKIIGFAVGHFGSDAPEIAEFIPQGRTIFGTATDDTINNHLATLTAAVTTHLAVLGANVLTLATDLESGWAAIYAASESSTAEKSLTEQERNAAREAVLNEIYLTTLHIGIAFPDQPGILGQFLQPHLGGGPNLGSGGGTEPDPDPNPGSSSSSFPDSSSSFFPPSSSSFFSSSSSMSSFFSSSSSSGP